MKCVLGNVSNIQEAIGKCDEGLLAYEVGQFYSRQNDKLYRNILCGIQQMRELELGNNCGGIVQVSDAETKLKHLICENSWQETLLLLPCNNGQCIYGNAECGACKQIARICHLMLMSGATQAEAKRNAYLHSNREGAILRV